MCPVTRSQWDGRRVCVYDVACPESKSESGTRGGGGRGEEVSVVFRQDQGQEVQWG